MATAAKKTTTSRSTAKVTTDAETGAPAEEKATNDADASNAAEVTDLETPMGSEGEKPSEESGSNGTVEQDETEGEATEGDGAEGTGEQVEPEEGTDVEEQLDSAQQAAVATSMDRAQMASAIASREFHANQPSMETDVMSNALDEVKRRDKNAMRAQLEAGRATPGPTAQVSSTGRKTGTGPDGTLAPVDLSGLAGPSHDALNPAYAVDFGE